MADHYIIITFPNTTAALAMEAAAKQAGRTGRLIPIPTRIRAGCGLAWQGADVTKEEMETMLQAHGLAYTGIHLLPTSTTGGHDDLFG